MLTGGALLLLLGICIVAIILMTSRFNVHPFLALFLITIFFGTSAGMGINDLLKNLSAGFGSILQQIGIIVSLGCLLGVILEKTGAIYQISKGILKIFGLKNASMAMGSIGALVGIPVFCDSGFIILSKLPAAIASQTSASAARLSLSLGAGLYTSHILVPPTPGPLAATANIGAASHIGWVILAGLFISIPVVIVSVYASKVLSAGIQETIHKSEDIVSEPAAAHLLPSLFLSGLPVAVPVVLIAMGSVVNMMQVNATLSLLFKFAGHPITALSIGILLSLLLMRKGHWKNLNAWVNSTLKDAGLILLITGMGGAFGSVIKATAIDQVIGGWLSGTILSDILLLIIAFTMAMVLKTAQGSSTSAMVIASSLIAPFLISPALSSPLGMALTVMALGGGAMTVSHANDSYFWVVTQFSNLSAKDAFKSYTLITLFQGMTVLICTLLLYFLLL